MDVAAIKAKEHKSWSTASPAWKRFDAELVAWAAPVTDAIVARLGAKQGQRVLDLASGTGEPSLAIAERVGPLGSVLGVDFVEPMIEFAREKANRRDLTNVEFRVEDCENLNVPQGTFDGASMRFGLMFFAEPVVALKRVHQAIKPGGRLVIGTWGPLDKNPWAAIPISFLKRYIDIPAPPPGAPGLFAFADTERLKSTLSQAGFQKIEIENVPNEVGSFQSGKAYCEFIFTLSGPLAGLLTQLPADKQARVQEEIAAELDSKFKVEGRLSIPGAAWVATMAK